MDRLENEMCVAVSYCLKLCNLVKLHCSTFCTNRCFIPQSLLRYPSIYFFLIIRVCFVSIVQRPKLFVVFIIQSGWFSKLFSWFSRPSTEIHLPDDREKTVSTYKYFYSSDFYFSIQNTSHHFLAQTVLSFSAS